MMPLKIRWKKMRRALAHAPSPQDEVARVQALHPPNYDPQNTLLKALRKCLPSEVNALFDYGIVWAGEVGIMEANARVRTLPASEEYVIEFYSGMKALLYTVARGISAATVIHYPPPTPPVKAVMNGQDVADMIGRVFSAYATTQQIVKPHHPAQQEQLQIAHVMATNAEFFLLAHEIAHVWMAYTSPASAKRQLQGYAVTWEEEFAADQFAITWLFTDAVAKRNGPPPPNGAPSLRMIYAGIEFALRVVACLEFVGMPFEGTHPDAKRRLDVIRTTAQKLCESTGESFDSLKTIATANDEFLEMIEYKVRNMPPPPINDIGKMRTKLIALMDELAIGRMDEDFVLAQFVTLRKYASDALLVEGACEVYNFYTNDRPPVARLLKQLMEKLPEPLPETFLSQLSATPELSRKIS